MCRRGQSANGASTRFHLIELLAVVTINAILASMLLPALQDARARAHRLLCLANQRQIGTVLLIYADDNNEILPRLDRYTNGFGGHYGPNKDWWSIYHDYFGQDLALNAAGTLSGGIRYWAGPFQCPANPRADSWRAAYVMCAGSAQDYPMSISPLQAGADKTEINRYGPGPALLADRAIVTDYPAGGIYRSETNHQNALVVEGGNALHLDGSAAWYTWRHNGSDKHLAYVANGAMFNLQAWPSTALIFQTDGDGLLSHGYVAASPNVQIGPNWGYPQNVFSAP